MFKVNPPQHLCQLVGGDTMAISRNILTLGYILTLFLTLSSFPVCLIFPFRSQKIPKFLLRLNFWFKAEENYNSLQKLI